MAQAFYPWLFTNVKRKYIFTERFIHRYSWQNYSQYPQIKKRLPSVGKRVDKLLCFYTMESLACNKKEQSNGICLNINET